MPYVGPDRRSPTSPSSRSRSGSSHRRARKDSTNSFASRSRPIARSAWPGSPEAGDERREIVRQRHFELERFASERMGERQPIGMERLAREGDRPEGVGAVDVALFADERVPAQPRLEPDLVAFAGDEPNLDERRRVEHLDDAVLA